MTACVFELPPPIATQTLCLYVCHVVPCVPQLKQPIPAGAVGFGALARHAPTCGHGIACPRTTGWLAFFPQLRSLAVRIISHRLADSSPQTRRYDTCPNPKAIWPNYTLNQARTPSTAAPEVLPPFLKQQAIILQPPDSPLPEAHHRYNDELTAQHSKKQKSPETKPCGW